MDIVDSGDLRIDCVDGDGSKCVDLDGNSKDAGVLTSISLVLGSGDYTFVFDLAGASSTFTSGSAQADSVVDVSIGGFFVDQITVPWATPSGS